MGALNRADFLPTWEEAEAVRAAADMRVSRTTPNGLSIAHGGGYDWIDADVLGGNGSGTRSRQASHLGFNFEVVGRGRESLCRECSRWA